MILKVWGTSIFSVSRQAGVFMAWWLFVSRWFRRKGEVVGQLSEGETAEGRSGVAACVGEGQACLCARGQSPYVSSNVCVFLQDFCLQTKMSSSDTFSVLIGRCNHLSRLEIRYPVKAQQTDSIHIFSLQRVISCYFGIRNWYLYVSVHMSKVEDVLMIYCLSFRVSNTCWRPSLWRISSRTEASCMKGGWCSLKTQSWSTFICSCLTNSCWLQR